MATGSLTRTGQAPARPQRLAVAIGQHSSAGRKPRNDDFYGALIPDEPALTLKGVALALADGISTSRISAEASSSAVRTFLTDYYCTSDAWSVKTAAQRVISAINSWLHAETRRSPYAYDADRGYVCTFTALVLKHAAAHIFHVGDSRVSRVAGRSLEQLTEDHRVIISSEQTYLGRALGIAPHIEIDYRCVSVTPGEVFVLTTDGVHDHLGAQAIVTAIERSPDDLDHAAREIIALAHEAGSPDNLTVQILRVDSLPPQDRGAVLDQSEPLPPAPILQPGTVLDGYRILRPLHASNRSHLFLARDCASDDTLVALKIPSIDLRDDPAYLRRFMMEEWVARRVNSPHVLKVHPPSRRRSHLYLVLEYLEGQTLAQWIRDHPTPDLETVRGIVEQIGRGLTAFHRKEMIHQDLRPENVMIDPAGTVKIIDFGSTLVAGVAEAGPQTEPGLFTPQYTAPECILGDPATEQADLFSLAVITYQMLTGHLPYGPQAARLRTPKNLRNLRYRPARDTRPTIPPWVDETLRKALHPIAAKRYEAVSEYTHDLRHPNPEFCRQKIVPLAERDPVLLWRAVSFALGLTLLCVLAGRMP